MGKGYRAGRLGEEIRKITSELLITTLRDPRLTDNMVSVTAVDVTSDGGQATIYLSVLAVGEKAEIEDKKAAVLEAMKNSKGVIKREISKQVKLRNIPELIFKMDTSLDYGMHIEELICEVKKEDDKK